jgi:hypothetical protein
MFDTENVALRVADINHRTMEHDEKEIGLVEMVFEMNPLTPALAGELDEYMKSMLFQRKDAEVTSKLGGATFRLGILPQEIVVKMAPDQSKGSFTIDEAKIGSFTASRSKKSTAWTLKFTATFHPRSKDELASVVDCYLKTRFCTFADASPDLFSEVGKEREKTAKAVRASDGASAAAH